MNKILGIMGVVGLLFAGCSSEDDILSSFHNDPNAVHITAEVGKASADGFTRSNPLGDAQKQKQFNEDDEISVKADGQEAVTYKFNGTEWVPQSGKFLKWESDEMNFTAYYPASFDGNITQPTEYTSEKSLAEADFMSYTGSQSNTNGNTLTLTMNRLMARVVVEIAGFNNQYAENTPVNSVSICGVKAYKHSVDNKDKYYALMVPCEAQDDKEFLSLEVGTGNTKETYTGIPALEAGKSYTYQLTVGKNKVVVTGITVADWTTGATLDGKTTNIPYVTFTAAGEQTFKMYAGRFLGLPKFQYSVNGGEWKTVESSEEVTFGGTYGDLRLRGTDNPNGTAAYFNSNYGSLPDNLNIEFSTDAKVACTGDIRTLLDYKTYKTVDTSNARFFGLFDNCTVLTSAPDLPATTLADNCYSNMFWGCSSLTTAPELPATTLADNCYSNMFWGCSSLTTAPELPAKTLAKNCYSNMFCECTNLKSVPELPATTLANYCYYRMFYGCTSLTSAKKLPATTLADYCYSGMFQECTGLESAPELPAITLAPNCYSYMFNGCTSLSSVTMLAPSDQITNKRDCCYYWLTDAGTKEGISRTLQVKNADAYTALKNNTANYYLPDNWQIGQCTVLAGDNSTITE